MWPSLIYPRRTFGNTLGGHLWMQVASSVMKPLGYMEAILHQPKERVPEGQ